MDLLSYELGKKASGGGDGGSSLPVWYSGYFFGEDADSKSTLTINVHDKISSTNSTLVRPVEKGLIIAFVRSEYSFSNNVTVLAESEYVEDTSGNRQKLIIGWCDNFRENITLTQRLSIRIAMYALPIQFCQPLTADDVLINTTTNQSSVSVTSTSNLCMYFTATNSSYQYMSFTNNDDFFNPYLYEIGFRMACFMRHKAGEVSIPTSTNGTALIGIELKGSSTR